MATALTLRRLQKRIEAIAPSPRQPEARWERVIINDPDPRARIAEHQRLNAGSGVNFVYRIIVHPDPATHAAGEAILGPVSIPPASGRKGSGIFERRGPDRPKGLRQSLPEVRYDD